MNHIQTVAFFSGIFVAAAIGSAAQIYLDYRHTTTPHTHDDDEVHVHSDWKMVINDDVQVFTDERFQSVGIQAKHEHIHLHDGDDLVIHRHADGITLQEFLASLGYTLTEDCLTTDANDSFCTNEKSVLQLYVNNELRTDITTYINQEADRILLYYGLPDNPRLPEYLASVTDESCLYTGTCLDRGYKTTSTCGLTCELE